MDADMGGNALDGEEPPLLGRKAYRLDANWHAEGGWARVHRGIAKQTGERIALKQLLQPRPGPNDEAVRRLRREVEVQQHLSPHAAVMPVLDVADDWTWYVMPLALGNLQELREQLDDAELLRAIDSAAWGLQAAHERGYSHRDVTPRNILALPDNSAPAGRRWVIADFGLVRRPPGQTTAVLTRSGQVIGTDGFVAPEMLRDSALNAGSAPDVYGLGRVAAWATTGTWPLAGEDLLPSGRWRAFVRAATNRDPRRRISDMTAFREMLPGVASTQEAVAPTVQAAALLAGHFPLLDTEDAAARVIGLALEHRDDTDLYFDHLVEVRGEPIVTLVADDPNDALALAEKMRDHLAPPGSLWANDRSEAEVPMD